MTTENHEDQTVKDDRINQANQGRENRGNQANQGERTVKNLDEQTVSDRLVCLPLLSAFSDFLIDRDLGGVRPATLKYYRAEVGLFLRWATAAGAQSLEDLTADVLRAYFLNLRNRRNAKSVQTNFGAVKAWLKWCWQEYELPGACPILRVRVAAPDTTPKPGVSLEAVGRLLEACQGTLARRDTALLYFLLDTGIRRREVCALTVGQFEGDTVALAADGTKTGRARPAFLSPDTIRKLRAYLATRRDLSPDAPLFANQYGAPLTPNGLTLVIKRLCKRAGLPTVGLHDFRRTFALESLRSGADLVTVSRLLGHTQIETTKRYLALTDDDLRESHARTSPVRKLRKRGGAGGGTGSSGSSGGGNVR